MIVGYRNSPRTPALSGTRYRDLARGRSSDMLRQRLIEGLQPLNRLTDIIARIACAIARYTGQSLFSYHNKLGLRRDSASMFEELALNVRAEGVRSDAEHLQCNVSPLLIDDNDFVHHQFLFGPFDPKRRSRFCGHGGTLDLTSIDRNGFVRILRPPPLDWPGQDAGLANPASRAYTLAKTIVHGLLVLMVWPVGVSVPVAWLTVNCTIVSVFFSSGGPKPSSALAA